jgi:hypothetical protein
VATAEKAHHDAFDDLFLTDDHRSDLLAEALQISREARDGLLDVARQQRCSGH